MPKEPEARYIQQIGSSGYPNRMEKNLELLAVVGIPNKVPIFQGLRVKSREPESILRYGFKLGVASNAEAAKQQELNLTWK